MAKRSQGLAWLKIAETRAMDVRTANCKAAFSWAFFASQAVEKARCELGKGASNPAGRDFKRLRDVETMVLDRVAEKAKACARHLPTPFGRTRRG